jgi:hypothetical protein
MIHNGCTTGIEAFALGVPAIAYRSRTHEEFDRDFHRVPNQLSHECFDLKELLATLEKVLAGESGEGEDEKRKSILNRHLAAQEGPLACERILDVLEELAAEMTAVSEPAFGDRLGAWLWTAKRRIKKRLRGYRQNMSHNKEDFLRYRYPEISLEDVHLRVSKFQELLHFDKDIKVELLAGQFFRLS